MNLLYVLCEGDDDERFFRKIVWPRLTNRYDTLDFYQYAEATAENVRRFIRSIHGMQNDGLSVDYLFLRDFDDAPSKSDRLDQVARRYQGLIEAGHTYLVIQMIESWYVAGLSIQNDVPNFGDAPPRTDDLDKRDFENLLADGASRADVLAEILRRFSIGRARAKNHSFEYFCSRVLDI